MAWPPAPLPINFGNATVSLNTHPQAHNETNETINADIVPEINVLRAGQTVYQGTNPAASATIVAATGILINTTTGTITRTDGESNTAKIAAYRGTHRQSFGSPGVVLGAAYVSAGQTTIPYAFPRGGYVVITTTVQFSRSGSQVTQTGAVSAGYGIATAPTWVGTEGVVAVTEPDTRYQATSSYTLLVDAVFGTFGLKLDVGVRTIEAQPGGLTVLSSAIDADCFVF